MQMFFMRGTPSGATIGVVSDFARNISSASNVEFQLAKLCLGKRDGCPRLSASHPNTSTSLQKLRDATWLPSTASRLLIPRALGLLCQRLTRLVEHPFGSHDARDPSFPTKSLELKGMISTWRNSQTSGRNTCWSYQDSPWPIAILNMTLPVSTFLSLICSVADCSRLGARSRNWARRYRISFRAGGRLR